MAGRDVIATRIGDAVKVEIRDATNPHASIANYGTVAPSGDMFGWQVASGGSGLSTSERHAVNRTAGALRHAERKRITDVVRDKASMPEFMPNDLGYSVADGFTIDGEPWEQWLSAMTMD